MPYYKEVQISEYVRRLLEGSDGINLSTLFKDVHSIQEFESQLLAYAPPMDVNLGLFKHIPKKKLDQIDPCIPAKFKWNSYRKREIETLLNRFVRKLVIYLTEFSRSEQLPRIEACIIALKSLRQTCNVLLTDRANQRNSISVFHSTEEVAEYELLLPSLRSLSLQRSRIARIESDALASSPSNSSIQAPLLKTQKVAELPVESEVMQQELAQTQLLLTQKVAELPAESEVMQQELAQTQLLLTQKVAELSRSEARLSELQIECAQEEAKISETLEQYKVKKRQKKQELAKLSQARHQLKQNYIQAHERYSAEISELKNLNTQRHRSLVQLTALSDRQSQVLQLLEQQLRDKYDEVDALRTELYSLRQRYSLSESQKQGLELQLQHIKAEIESAKSSFQERNQALVVSAAELQALVDSNGALIVKLKAELQEKEAQLTQAKERLQSLEVESQRRAERDPRGAVGLASGNEDAEQHKMAEVIKSLQSQLASSIPEQDLQRLTDELALKSSALMAAERQLTESTIKETAQLNRIARLQKKLEELEVDYKENLSAFELNGQKLIAQFKEERDKLESDQVLQINTRVQELTDVHHKALALLKAQYLEKEKAASDAVALQAELKLKINQLHVQFEVDKMGIRDEVRREFQTQVKELEENYGRQIADLKRLQTEQQNALISAQQANLKLESLVRDLQAKLEMQTELLRAKEHSLQEAESRRVDVETGLSKLQIEQVKQVVKLQQAQESAQRGYAQKLQQLELEFTKQKEVLEQDLSTKGEQYTRELQAKDVEIAAIRNSLKQVEAEKAELQLQEPGLTSQLESELIELREVNIRLIERQKEMETSVEERISKYKTQFQKAQELNDEQQQLYDDQQQLYDDLEKERDGLLNDLERITSERDALQLKLKALPQPSLRLPLSASQKANELTAVRQERLHSSEASTQSLVRTSSLIRTPGKANKPV